MCRKGTKKKKKTLPPVQPGHDLFFWSHMLDGWYSSKSGYEFIGSSQRRQVASSSSSSTMSASVWRLSRCKDLMWRACLSLLPVCGALRRRGIDVDPSCPWCELEVEYVSYVLLFQSDGCKGLVCGFWPLTSCSLWFL